MRIDLHRKSYTASVIYRKCVTRNISKTQSNLRFKIFFIPNRKIELTAFYPHGKLLLFVFKFNSESQATPDLFMHEMSGAGELTSHAMPMHKIFKPALDN